MPLYTYICYSCARTWEAQVKVDDRHTQQCTCGEWGELIPAAPAVHFKGSGFYETDYKRKGK